jgi:hypothetical protein
MVRCTLLARWAQPRCSCSGVGAVAHPDDRREPQAFEELADKNKVRLMDVSGA